MSLDMTWEIDKYREEYESEEHWQLRRAFMERWKEDYEEERLVCLARVFANIELMGCRYPTETMLEVARLSQDIASKYRKQKKTRLQRTFVSASDAAEDRAKGIKREGGIIKDSPNAKSKKIEFVKQGQSPPRDAEPDNKDLNSQTVDVAVSDDDVELLDEKTKNNAVLKDINDTQPAFIDTYLEEMSKMRCLDVKYFRNDMFMTPFGRFVLLIRSWIPKLSNIEGSSQACRLPLNSTYQDNLFTLTLNGTLLAQATGPTRQEAKKIVETLAWNRLREEAVSILVKEQWIAHEDRQISMREVSGAKHNEFGTPIESTVATKMMKLMGWKGGGLGAEAQGIAEPIKPSLQMVNRAGLGSNSFDINQLRRKGFELMRRYLESDLLDVDLVFSSEFSKEERAVLHMCAKKVRLASRSYGGEADRFLVVKKKLDPFSLVTAVVEKGGVTPKYIVYIPAALQNR